MGATIIQPQYPIYIPSKGRFDPKEALTVRALRRDNVPFTVVVEPQQREVYTQLVGASSVLALPDENFGKGSSTPARNWIRDHAEALGFARHWQLDDNLIEFRRLWRGRRIPCHAGIALRVCEDLSDRFINVGVSGLNYQMFVPAETPVPYYRNTHIYSCTLVSHKMPYRWRMRYNEDTDLCLQALVGGWCTIALNAFMVNKMRTMTMKGGNTDVLYQGASDEAVDHRDTVGRFEMARVLERAWPGLVTTRRKFGRYQHSVNWRNFTRQLERDPSFDPDILPTSYEYGLQLRAIREVKSPALQKLLSEW